jgi:hypothetical protein
VGATGDNVCVDVAAIGFVGATGATVGVTAGVSESGLLVTEKAPVVADELAFGSAAGTTVPVWLEVQPRPWHTVEVELEVALPVTAGRPLTLGVVAAGWALPWLPWLPWLPGFPWFPWLPWLLWLSGLPWLSEPVVGSVVVLDGVVVVDVAVVPVVGPVAPAARSVVVPVGVTPVLVVVAGVVLVGAGVVTA